jgi:hypothetical protein
MDYGRCEVVGEEVTLWLILRSSGRRTRGEDECLLPAYSFLFIIFLSLRGLAVDSYPDIGFAVDCLITLSRTFPSTLPYCPPPACPPDPTWRMEDFNCD